MSQKNYNFKFNPPEPTSEQINKHKDFGALLARFEAETPVETSPLRVVSNNKWRRNLVYISSIAAAAILALVVYLNVGNSDIESIAAERMMAQPYVNPMLKPLQKEYKSFTVDGSLGGIFEYESGSKVTVPANAFVNAAGELVTGEIELKYKEFHDFVDFFVSGIPMRYDSAGMAHQLVSAGMIDIQAFQNGEPVQMKPNKTLDIELVSSIHYHPNHVYNIYKLNTEQRNWNYKGLDQIEPILTGELKAKMDKYLTENANSDEGINAINSQIAALQQQQAQELAAIESTIPKPEPPLKPQSSNPDNFVTNFEFDDLDKTDPRIAELANKYGNLLWEVSADQEAAFNIASNENASWDDVRLEKLNDVEFKVTLISGVPNGKNLTLRVKPVLAGADYQKALEDYNAKLENYTQLQQARENQLKSKKTALAQRTEVEISKLENQKQDFEKRTASSRQKGFNNLIKEEIANQKVINKFKISSFGIWNCGRPVLPNQDIKAKFQTENNAPLEFWNAYLVNKKQNTVTHFLTTGNQISTIKYANDAENMLWVVGNDGSIKVISPKEFDKIDKNATAYTFKFEPVTQPIKTEKDLRAVLTFE